MYWANPNITRPLDLLTYINTITGDIFWTLIVFAMFIIVYLALSMHNFRNAILPAFFLSGFSAAIFYGVGLVDQWVPAAMLISSALAT